MEAKKHYYNLSKAHKVQNYTISVFCLKITDLCEFVLPKCLD